MSYYTPAKLITAALFAFASSILLAPASSAIAAGDARPSPHAVITNGCSEIAGGMIPSRAESLNGLLEPICWASELATGGDRHGLQGTLPAPGWAGYHGAGRVSVWTGHGGFWAPGSDGKGDNDRLRQQWLSWLLGSGTRLGFPTTHGEGASAETFRKGALGKWLDSEGIEYSDIKTALSSEVLSKYDALFIGNTWNGMRKAERDAVVEFVENGGGVIVLSLGWAYYQYNDDPEGDDVLVNQLGEVFGWKSVDGTIDDPNAPNGEPNKPSYAIRPLSEYTPAEVVILRVGEVDVNTVHQLAADEPGNIYVIEGKYTGLQLPTEKWADLNDPAAALAALENMFEVQLELAGGALPYGQRPTWFIARYDPKGRYYMHSGNPIVYKVEAAKHVVESLNEKNYPGWGFPHENGHNMVIAACGNLFVHGGTGEEWCNVFNVYTHYQLGWTSKMDNRYQKGWDYHAQENPDFAYLTSDNWVLLGCMQLVWDKYGWDGMHKFFAQAGRDKASGMKAGDNNAKMAYFVELLSHAYQLNFAPLLTHWGFPVSDESRAITAQYPLPDKIEW